MHEQQRILAISGRKQAGKNTACNFVAGMELASIGAIRNAFYINEDGQLWVSDIYGDEEGEGILDLMRDDVGFVSQANEHIFPYVKVYSCADLLKREVCMKVLGLTKEQCFGTDEQKNTPTHLRWENMPGVVTKPHAWDAIQEIRGRLGTYYTKFGDMVYHEPGEMTARQVLQFVGTEVFRKMYQNVWIDALIRQIKAEDSLYALICDIRFPNEVEGVLDAGGKVVRLTKDVFKGQDAHESEIALDADRFDHSRFSAILDNDEMNIDQQNSALYNILRGWDWAPEQKG